MFLRYETYTLYLGFAHSARTTLRLPLFNYLLKLMKESNSLIFTRMSFQILISKNTRYFESVFSAVNYKLKLKNYFIRFNDKGL